MEDRISPTPNLEEIPGETITGGCSYCKGRQEVGRSLEEPRTFHLVMHHSPHCPILRAGEPE